MMNDKARRFPSPVTCETFFVHRNSQNGRKPLVYSQVRTREGGHFPRDMRARQVQSQTSHSDLPTLGSLSSGPGPDMTLEAHRRHWRFRESLGA